jgi:hypothetical protein
MFQNSPQKQPRASPPQIVWSVHSRSLSSCTVKTLLQIRKDGSCQFLRSIHMLIAMWVI